jgi:hypothetical protein
MIIKERRKMVQKIETIKKKFPREWLIIAVDRIDEATTTPISGKLLFHSPHRDSAYRRLLVLKRKCPILIEYSQDKMPKGFAAAF